MRVVFMGSPAFAIPSLGALAAEHQVIAAYTREPQPSGRGGAARPTPVHAHALALGIPTHTPRSLREPLVVEELDRLRPDVICVAAYGLILPPEVLAIPPAGCINVHASLLPRYRGAAPVARAILEGEEHTGVSIMLMEAGLDTGPYAAQVPIGIDDLYAEELTAALAEAGAEALLRVLDEVAVGSAAWTPQDERLATYAPKVTKDHVSLDPCLPVDEAYRRVRASSHNAPARVCVGDDRELTVVRARPVALDVPCGTLDVRATRPVIGFEGGALELLTVRPAGKSDMPGEAWARGVRTSDTLTWRCTR